MGYLLIYLVLLHYSHTTSAVQTCYDPSTYCANSWLTVPVDCNPSLSVQLPDIYANYCSPNEAILWKNGISDGSVSHTNIVIDHNFIICQNLAFSSCGYVPLQATESVSECGQATENSGVIFGSNIDLASHTEATLSSLGASTHIVQTVSDYCGLKGTIAAEAICQKPFRISAEEAYNLTISVLDQYATEVQQWYDQQRTNNTLSFTELPLGVRTVMTSVYSKWGEMSKHPIFWSNIKSNNFENAIKTLRSWYYNGATDKRLSAEANVLESSFGCVADDNMIDIVFLLDTSGSVGSDHFNFATKWIIRFIQSFNQMSLKSGAVRFGVATFADDYSDWIHLDEFSTFDDYNKSIVSIPYNSGGTYLGNALQEIAVNQFIESNGMRPASEGVSRLLVVLTDGESSDDFAIEPGIKTLNNLNLNIIAIGIGSYDMEQLQQIATIDNIYGLDKFPDLDQILSSITVKTCNIPTQLNINNNAVIQDVVIQKYGVQYFEILSSTNAFRTNANIILNITQHVGCVYIYVSDSVQYPSYFESDVQFASCAQSFKQIILSPANGTNIYIAIEGRQADTSYSMNIGDCDQTICEVGSNYNPELNVDPPYVFDKTSTFSNAPIDTTTFAQLYQPSVTETPIFMVSILLGVVILIWASLHFLCKGLDTCKNAEVGEISEIQKFIFHSERNKFMSYFSVCLIIWELCDFILDLVTMISIFVKGQEPGMNTPLYMKCGVASAFAFIASVLLFVGKVYLWKTFYPQINQHRQKKSKNVAAMTKMKQKESGAYKKIWDKYYMHQKQIGIYLGDLIMYDLFGVSLEDCIQITVTWYIKNDLFFAHQNGFMTGWLYLTFIASILSVAFKLFRALLLKLGCHHDSYRADLKPEGYKLLTDLRPVYFEKQTLLVSGVKNLTVKPSKIEPIKSSSFQPVPMKSDVSDVSGDEPEPYSFSNELKNEYASQYGEMRQNEWSPHIEEIHKGLETGVGKWAHEQVNQNETLKNKMQQMAENDVLTEENMRIVYDLKQKGIDVSAYYEEQNNTATQKQLHSILSAIERDTFDKDIEEKYSNETQVVSAENRISEQYEIHLLEWALQELKGNEKVKQQLLEQAMNEFASGENQRIVDMLKSRGIDTTDYVKQQSPRQAYTTLSNFEKDTSHVEIEIKTDSSVKIDSEQ